ncbi:MAG: sugar phosphate isomerase/epimerase family protein [Planctomycetota bacterium]|jgi:sugar phosphate isomerase/epimerase
MLLGFNTNGLQNHRLEDALRLLADHGYQVVALTLDVQHLDPFRVGAREVDATAKLLEQLGLAVIVETGARFLLDPAQKHEPTLMSREPAARDRRLDFYRRAANIGQDLGADLLSFWSGIDRKPQADAWSWLCDGVEQTCSLVREQGLVPCVEPEPGMSLGRLGDYERLRTELGDSSPALTLDVGHLLVNEEEAPEALIRRAAPYLAQVQLEDMRRGVHEHLVPGEGEVDFRKVMQTLEEQGFAAAVCFEISRSSHKAPEVLEICSRVWRESRS